ncbi:hypothetical protein BH11VER1_BH11VER1_02270 [soil metagenome]
MFSKFDYYFLTAAFISFALSIGLWFFYNQGYGLYVGIWVPSILAFWTGVRVVLLDKDRH